MALSERGQTGIAGQIVGRLNTPIKIILQKRLNFVVVRTKSRDNPRKRPLCCYDGEATAEVGNSLNKWGTPIGILPRIKR